jgi:hypothetical protein
VSTANSKSTAIRAQNSHKPTARHFEPRVDDTAPVQVTAIDYGTRHPQELPGPNSVLGPSFFYRAASGWWRKNLNLIQLQKGWQKGKSFFRQKRKTIDAKSHISVGH